MNISEILMGRFNKHDMNRTIFNSVSKDLVLSTTAMCLMNGTIQLLVNPYLQKQMGNESFGVVLAFLSVVAIVATTFGTSLNYSRMLKKKNDDSVITDYFGLLMVFCLIAIAVSVFSFYTLLPNCTMVGCLFFTVFSVMRYYGDVFFKLNTDFKSFFFYYFLMTVAYICMIFFFRFIKSWIIVYLVAEIVPVAYVFRKSKIIRKLKNNFSPDFSKNAKSSAIFIGTNLISSFVMNFDRPLILSFVSADAVTVYYVATLIGKAVSLLTMPINGVLISYISKYQFIISRRRYLFISAFLLLPIFVLSVCCVIGSHVFIKLIYPDVFEKAKPLIMLTVTGQIFYFIAGSLFVLILGFSKEIYQLVTNLLYLVIVIVCSVIGIMTGELVGLAIGSLVANASRFVIAIFLGLKVFKDQNILLGEKSIF